MRSVVAVGGDLYHLALQYLGDGTQWNRIAQANNLLDPVIVGTVTLQIPSVNPNAGGGILVR
jgi:nucleoid-associated protein YgaU